MAEKVVSVRTRSGGVLPVDGPIAVVNREAGSFVVAHGWHLRFQSGDRWALIDLADVEGYLFEGEPGGRPR